MNCPILTSASLYPLKPALITNKKIYSYRELNELISCISKKLISLGVQKSEKIAFNAKADEATIFFLFSLLRIDAIACPLNPKLPQPLLESQLKQLGAHHFFDTQILSFQTLSTHSNESLPNVSLLIFTSGSSSLPKIAALSSQSLYYSALGSNLQLGLCSEDTWLLSVPIFHVSGFMILMRCFLAGACVLIQTQPLLEMLKEKKPTHLSLVPTQLSRLLKESKVMEKSQIENIRAILLGGAPISSTLWENSRSSHFKIFPTYGLTEMCAQVTMNDSKDSKFHLGKPLPFRNLKISSSNHEILVQGHSSFLGYFSKNNPLSKPVDSEGWYETKDIGRLNQDGNLEFIGRKDHLFISGGENIQPEEIENYLYQIPGILEAIVVPIEDEEFGKRPVAFILKETNSSKNFSPRHFLEKILPSYKIPLYFFHFPNQLGNVATKVNRLELKMIAEAFVKQSKAFVESKSIF